MITPKYSFEPRERAAFEGKRAYFNPSFFRGEWKRSWPKTLCYTLFLFFVLPLPLLFELNSRRSWTSATLTESVTRLLGSNVWLYCFAAFAVAVFAGALATRYLNRRVSADFYHSLPIRREGLLIRNWLMGVLHFLTALAINLALSFVILMTVMDMLTSFSLPLGKLGQAAGYMMVTFLLFYTLTVFCGMLCGTSSMQVMLTGLALGAFPLFRALALTFCSMFVDNINLDHFMANSWGWTSPLIRLFYLLDTEYIYREDIYREDMFEDVALENPLLWYEIVLWIVAAAVLLLGALQIYRRRRVERAGTPIVFDGVAAAVKWVVVLLGTMALGWLFMELGSDSGFWMIFGFLLGGFLSFLLINSILTKNPKQMFDGWKKLLIFIVAFCVLFVGIGFAISKLEDIVPRNVKRVAIELEYNNYNVPYYEDPAVIKAWQELWRETEPGTEYQATAVQWEDTYWTPFEEISVEAAVQVGPFVIPYEVRHVSRIEAEALIRAMTDSQEFEEGFDETVAQVEKASFSNNEPIKYETNSFGGPEARLTFFQLFANHYSERIGEKGSRLPVIRYTTRDDFERMLSQIPEDIGFEFFQQPTYAVADVSYLNREIWDRLDEDINRVYGMELPVTMEMPSLIEDLIEMDVETFYGAMADNIWTRYRGMYVVRSTGNSLLTIEEDNSLYVTDREQIIEVLRGMAMLDTDGKYTLSPFTVPDGTYWVVIQLSGATSAIPLIKGKVPAFVTEALG